VLDELKRHAGGVGNKVSSSSSSSDSVDAGGLSAKLTHVSSLFDRLRYVTQYSYTLLSDQLQHVSAGLHHGHL